ncbi:MAG: hypothetical protein LBR73_03680 [Oscillospiraceae bacterium]|jgi:hypothetical protein|nr:hypothetical protein [Oscillospiraceae bacterium]
MLKTGREATPIVHIGKRTLAAILAVLCLLTGGTYLTTVLSFAAAAEENTITLPEDAAGLLQAGSISLPDSPAAAKKEAAPGKQATSLTLEEYVVFKLQTMETNISIQTEGYRILLCNTADVPADSAERSAFLSRIFYDWFYDLLNANPDLFFVGLGGSFSYYEMTGKLYVGSIQPKYTGTKSELAAMQAAFAVQAARMLAAVPSGVTEAEKALAVHDYICQHMDYAYTTSQQPDMARTSAYDALVGRKGVCQAYSLAFTYAMTKLGIETKIVSSLALNHVWVLVKADGAWYHIDVTYDDPAVSTLGKSAVKPDRWGFVQHKYFLKSDAYMKRNGHTSWDDEEKYASTGNTYDTSFLDSLETGCFYYNGEWYTFPATQSVSEHNLTAYTFRTGASRIAYTETQNFLHASGGAWVFAPKLVEYGGALYYNVGSKIMKYDFAARTASVYFTLPSTYTKTDGTTAAAASADSFYEIKTDFVDGKEWLYYTIANAPNVVAAAESRKEFTTAHTHYITTVRTESTHTAAGSIAQVCAICGVVASTQTLPAVAHTWGDWTVTAAATCGTDGVRTHTCTVCGTIETNPIPKTNQHTYREVVTPATEDAEGYTENVCTVCGYRTARYDITPRLVKYIGATTYESTFWNWILYIIFFGWLWMPHR